MAMYTMVSHFSLGEIKRKHAAFIIDIWRWVKSAYGGQKCENCTRQL